MSERKEPYAFEELAALVHADENAKEEARREEFLAANLFHSDFAYFDDGVSPNGLAEHAERLAALHSEFMADKKGKNMGERFEMALSEKYLGKIHVVELGVTDSPSRSGDIDGLKHEYNDHLEWMKDHKLVENELSREESNRDLECWPTPLTKDLVIIARNRPLIVTEVTVTKEDGSLADVKVGIAKRMIFSAPTALISALKMHDPTFKNGLALSNIETLLERKDKKLTPIRTTYYLQTEVRGTIGFEDRFS